MSGENLEARLVKVEEGIESITQFIRESASGGEGNSEEESKVSVSNPLENMTDSEIEGLSNRDLIQLFNKQLQGAVQHVDKRLSEGLSETRDDFSKEQITRDLKNLMKDHPEIKHLRNEFKEVFKNSPGLPVEDVYNLITVKYPDSVKAAQSKVKKDAGEEDSEDEKGSGEKGSEEKEAGKEEAGQNQKGDETGSEDAKAAKGSGGGMTPSGSGGSSGGSTGSSEGKGSMKEAGEEAWSEVFGSQEIVSPS